MTRTEKPVNTLPSNSHPKPFSFTYNIGDAILPEMSAEELPHTLDDLYNYMNEWYTSWNKTILDRSSQTTEVIRVFTRDGRRVEDRTAFNQILYPSNPKHFISNKRKYPYRSCILPTNDSENLCHITQSGIASGPRVPFHGLSTPSSYSTGSVF